MSFSRRPLPSRAAAQALAAWTSEEWADAIVASPTIEQLAARVNVSRETVRAALYRVGVLGKHRRYAAVREQMIAARETTAWAAE